MLAEVHNQSRMRLQGILEQRRNRWLAAAIVGLHVALAVLWSVVVPLGEGPDEPGHFNYVLFLARTNRLPVQQADPQHSDVPGEGHQPPLAYWLMQPTVRWLPIDERVLEIGENSSFMHNGGSSPNAFFRRSLDIWPYRGTALAWHLARGVSAVLGGITVALTYRMTRRCFPEQVWLAPSAAALLAFNPQFIFAHALVSNDPLLITLSTGLIYVCILLVTERSGDSGARKSTWWSLVAGLVLGLMLITKQSALAFVPLPFLALMLRGGSTKQVLSRGALLAAVTALLSWWWYRRNIQLYGDWLGLASFQETFAVGGFNPASLQDWANGLWNLLRSSWGNFGWQTLPMNDGAYRVFAVFLALALAGLIASAGQRWWTGRARVASLFVAASGLAFGWTVAFARLAGAVAWQGRFLFPAASAIVVLLACGLSAALPRRAALWTLLSLLVVLAVALPGGLVSPAYSRYVLPTQPANFGNVYGRFDVGWKRGVELRNVEFPHEVTVGDTVPVTLTWHALEQMDRPWTVFIHLVDANEEIVDEHNAQPVNGKFPMSSWVRGDWVRDSHQLPLKNARPGEYRLWIGLWDAESGARLGVYNQEGTLVNDRVEVGPVIVTDQ